MISEILVGLIAIGCGTVFYFSLCVYEKGRNIYRAYKDKKINDNLASVTTDGKIKV